MTVTVAQVKEKSTQLAVDSMAMTEDEGQILKVYA